MTSAPETRVRTVLKWALISVLGLSVLVYLLLLGGLWLMQDRLFFGRSTREIVETPAVREWRYEDVWREVDGERTHGWWIPVQGARWTVLFSHGSGRNISGYLEDVALFREQGLSVLLYDYGGYGRSSGKSSEQRCYQDIRAMWAYLVHVLKIPPERIILAGASMGGGVTMELATQVTPAAVILESTFTAIPDALFDTYPFIPANWICHIQFRNIDKVGLLHCPVLIMHSEEDTVVPFVHGKRLYDNITAPKRFVPLQGAHYGGKFQCRDTYQESLARFLAECF